MSKCKKCKSDFKPTQPLQIACSLQCAIELAKLKVKKDKEQKWKKDKSELKEKLKTVSDYRKEARFWFQRWIRIRDLGSNCICCGVLLTDIRDYDAGHYFNAYSYPQLLFSECNVSGCCVYCNKHLSGNLIEYRKGIIERYGMNVLLDLESLADDKTKRVLKKEYYIEIANEYKNRCKFLEK